MATARILDAFWLSSKRRRLERFLAQAGHRWPDDPARGPMCGGECIARALAFLDGRGDPAGSLAGLDDGDLELEAGWNGKPGLLVQALVECGWIDVTPDGRWWHDFGAFNAKAIAARKNGAQGGRPRKAGSVRDRRGAYRGPQAEDGPPHRGQYETQHETHDVTQEGTHTKPMTKQSESESGSGSGSESGVASGSGTTSSPPGGGGGLGGSGGETRSTTTTTTQVAPPPQSPDPEGADPVETLAVALHARAGRTRSACDDAATELLAAVGGDLPWCLGYLMRSPPALEADVFEWKRAAIDAWRAETAEAASPETAPQGPRRTTAKDRETIGRHLTQAIGSLSTGRVVTARHWLSEAERLASTCDADLDGIGRERGIDVEDLQRRCGA